MIAGRIEGATRYLGAPPSVDKEDCSSLAIRDIPSRWGNQMWSVWEPTPKELEQLAGGAKLYLIITGIAHPMVALCVGTHIAADIAPGENA